VEEDVLALEPVPVAMALAEPPLPPDAGAGVPFPPEPPVASAVLLASPLDSGATAFPPLPPGLPSEPFVPVKLRSPAIAGRPEIERIAMKTAKKKEPVRLLALNRIDGWKPGATVRAT
jgi:hypothetical protein